MWQIQFANWRTCHNATIAIAIKSFILLIYVWYTQTLEHTYSWWQTRLIVYITTCLCSRWVCVSACAHICGGLHECTTTIGNSSYLAPIWCPYNYPPPSLPHANTMTSTPNLLLPSNNLIIIVGIHDTYTNLAIVTSVKIDFFKTCTSWCTYRCCLVSGGSLVTCIIYATCSVIVYIKWVWPVCFLLAQWAHET